MNRLTIKAKRSAPFISLLILAACGGAQTATSVPADCVPLGEEGTFYVTNADGLLVPAERPETAIRLVAEPKGWARDLESTFPEMGFSWMKIDVKGEVATLVGLAPTQEEKDRGFTEGKAAIMNDMQGGRQVTIVADGIAVQGGEAALGAALSRMSDTPSVAACQRTFSDTMQGRNVEFRTSSATIRPESARLLDVVTGVAFLCKEYQIEIGGHTDVRGSSEINQRLSESRAIAVKEYLVARGVPEERLTAIGYGETQPIDPTDSLEAYRKNRRTEFIVRQP